MLNAIKAEIKPRVELENRTKLEEVIPLKTPFVLHIETANICNLRCRFCPVGDHDLIKKSGIKQGTLPVGLFKKIIDDLPDFKDKIKAIHLYGNGEPLLNKHFAEMIKYAKSSGYIEFIDTTTNGLLLKPEKIDAIIESGLDKINISVNGLSEEQYYKNTSTRIDFAAFLNNLKYLFENRGQCKIYIKSISELYDDTNKNRFFDLFSPVADYIFLENLTDPWPHYKIEEKMDTKSRHSAFSDKIDEKLVCSLIFYTLVINFDGTASLCCVDWNNDLVIGDIKTSSLKEIWQSDSLYNHQIQHLQGERFNNIICRGCNQISQCIIDNIDPYRLVLADKVQKLRGI